MTGTEYEHRIATKLSETIHTIFVVTGVVSTDRMRRYSNRAISVKNVILVARATTADTHCSVRLHSMIN